jgi:transcriptional regulator with XRE-family HTH domain
VSELRTAIGDRIRRLRAKNQVTMGQLARGSGIAKATLSAVEAGRSNPTIETLFAIATFLNVPLTSLIQEAPRPSVQVVRLSERPKFAGHHTRVHLDYVTRFPANGVTIELSLFEIQARMHYESPPHSQGVVERLVVHRGRLRVGPLETPVSLEPGDFLSFTADVRHMYEAANEDVVATVLIQYPTVE